MEKIGIVTMNDNNNYGNRLQNYALQEVIRSFDCEVITMRNDPYLNSKKKYAMKLIKYFLNKTLKKNSTLRKLLRKNNINKDRAQSFNQFNKYIKFNKRIVTPYTRVKKRYDYFVVGSDQVWNPFFNRMSDIDLLKFANPNQKIAFSASFGVDYIDKKHHVYLKKELSSFKGISVREDAGKTIIDDLGIAKDVEVLIDPTMMLSSDDWTKVMKKPEQLKSEKYILTYFLGTLPEKYDREIKRIAKENNCDIINILDKSSPFYKTGPSEFLYLEKNAFLVCTDSFHSCVFSIIFDIPFIHFERIGKTVSMNSRTKTLLTKFSLQNRNFVDKIEKELLTADYKNAKNILQVEIKKARNYLKEMLEIKDDE